MPSLAKLKRRLHYYTTLVTSRLTLAFAKTTGRPRLRFYCPACERDIWDWAPLKRDTGSGRFVVEPGGRRCPLCGSFERTRHFALYLKQTGLLASKPRMLHFAPESGLKPHLRALLGEKYVTTDLYMSRVDCREDITRMTFPDNAFDLIYCSNVLEHIEDDGAAIGELFRVLRPGGCAIIQVPIRGLKTFEDPTITDPHGRWKYFGQVDHVRYYGEDFKDRLERPGFSVTPFYMLDVLDLASGDVKRMNLGKRELLHKCVKPESAAHA